MSAKKRHEPRYFQLDAFKATVSQWKESPRSKPYFNLFTALGKSLVAAMFISWTIKKGGRILVLVPKSELVDQNYKEAKGFIDNPELLGQCCNKLGKHQPKKQAIIAMHQSIASRVKLAQLGSFDVILIDECHNVSSNENSQLRKILAHFEKVNPNVLIAGMTATHYRTGEGMLHEKSIYGEPYFTDLVYDSTVDPGIPRLIEEGYLAKIETLNSSTNIDVSDLKASGRNDFKIDEVGVKFGLIKDAAVEDMAGHFKREGIKTALIFVSNVKSGYDVIEAWKDQGNSGHEIRMIHGGMGDSERKSNLKWLEIGQGNRYLINCEILTEGYNYPALECVVMMRATISLQLLVQIIGRLIRPFGDKIGFFLDYGTNLDRLMPLGMGNIKPPAPKLKKADPQQKICLVESCQKYNALTAKKCVKCGAFFVTVESTNGNYVMRTQAEVLRLEREAQKKTVNVTGLMFDIGMSAGGNKMVIAKYYDGYKLVHAEYLLFEYDGYPRIKARTWLKENLANMDDYYELSQADGGVNCDNAHDLLCGEPELLKPIESIILIPKETNKRLFDLVGTNYKNVLEIA